MVRNKVDYLTDVQARLLRVIRERITEDGEAPTVKELCAAAGMSVGGVHYQLGELEAKHAIIRDRRRARGIRLT
ncbi:LexA family protein [Streptomyces cylindrosporus]|uniref:LexA repressor DNA-binding domain-containing protein n=1 Tax=Streptomyces cylindrosporus TaxID=2927583 RepID=A0ABS9YNX5_9ACTN|nr:hypothetical protein [Streptomyces cylindrosporus]MCI3277546.1 hypothetical protein [Streptomyces cylindrosporus]